MNCPRCGLTNPPSTLICDCGYDFNKKHAAVAKVHRPSNTYLYKWLFFSIKGRANRTQYFFGLTILLGLSTVLSIISIIMAFFLNQPFLLTLIVPAHIGYVLASIFLSVKRLHDFNMHGALLFLALIPLVNFMLGFIMLVLEGTRGPNQYGIPTYGFKHIGSTAGVKSRLN